MRILCHVRLHHWGPFTSDEGGLFRVCTRCGKIRESHGPGPDGFEQVWRHSQPGGG
jgi:hypothetical protein